jgi:ferrochelatase
MKWLEPSTVGAILEAREAKTGVLIDPVSFVSEHIETLVELDRDYAALAAAAGIAPFLRAPAVGVAPAFISGLASAVERALEAVGPIGPDGAACRPGLTRCALRDPELCH